jgi:hypothetical protein
MNARSKPSARVRNQARLAQVDDRAIVLHRRIAPLEVLAGFRTRHDTPPGSETYAESFFAAGFGKFAGGR